MKKILKNLNPYSNYMIKQILLMRFNLKKLFRLAEMNIKEIENNEKDFKKFEPLLKLYDKADIINEIQS